LKTRNILTGQIALVTGASSGIGKSIAVAMGEAGASVVVNYIGNSDPADEVVSTIHKNGGKAIAIEADVSKENQVKNMFKKMFSEYGTIHILVNNAGIQKDSPFLDMTLEQWNGVISVNLTGYFLCAREAAKEFVKRGIVKDISRAAGKIICISSVHEVIPWAGHCNYTASKGGILMFMKSIAQELAPLKIRVNNIAPGAIKTPINRKAWDTKEAEEKLLKLIPYDRVGVPQDIGSVAVWLASDEADYIQGTTIFVDGGMCLFPGFATGG
jgi:glucose 1-dehydrogenase